MHEQSVALWGSQICPQAVRLPTCYSGESVPKGGCKEPVLWERGCSSWSNSPWATAMCCHSALWTSSTREWFGELLVLRNADNHSWAAAETMKLWLSTASRSMELLGWERKLNSGVFHLEAELKLMHLKEDEEVLFAVDSMLIHLLTGGKKNPKIGLRRSRFPQRSVIPQIKASVASFRFSAKANSQTWCQIISRIDKKHYNCFKNLKHYYFFWLVVYSHCTV